MKIIADLHTHTMYSHGKGRVLDNVTAALAQGLEAVGITDHGTRSAPWVRTTMKGFAAMRSEVTELNRRTIGCRALAGAECNITSLHGELDVPLMIRQQLDIVLAGLHPGVMPSRVRDWILLAGSNLAGKVNSTVRSRARAITTGAVVEAVLRNDIDVITHPGYRLDIDTRELARACAIRGTALEINARHHEVTAAFCTVAAEEGARFVISSDAHKPAAVGNLDHGIAVATAAGLTAEQVLNADGGGLFAWLEERRVKRTSRGYGWAEWTAQPPLDRAPHEAPGARPDAADDPADDRLKRLHLANGGLSRSDWADWSSQGNLH